MKRLAAIVFILFMTASAQLPAQQDSQVVFEGRPLRKVESAFERTTESSLTSDDAFKYSVRILERGGKYYWASREMRELLRHEAGAYITFISPDGAGYIRVGNGLLLNLRDQLPAEQRAKEIGYVEHLLTQFASITYYGNRLGSR